MSVRLDANVGPFIAELAKAEAATKRLREEMAKAVKVDVDVRDAMAKVSELEQQLGRVDGRDATARVDADTSRAESQLRDVDSQMSHLSGRDARIQVDADVSGALSGLAMVAAGLAALPAVTSVAVSVAALGGAFTAAGVGAAGFAAVAVPSMGRINEALKAQASAAQSAGAATGGAGQSAAQAASQALQLEAAEKRLADAQGAERQAQEDLTRAREAGRRALEDMNFSLERSVLSQKDAALAVEEAEARLSELYADKDASELQVRRAMLNVEQAHQRAREQETKTQRAKKDTAEANREGVKGTAEYEKGLDKLGQAQAKVAESAAALKQMQLQQQAAMSGGGGAASKLKDAFADLSTQEKALAKDMQAFSKEYLDWQRGLQPDVFPAIHQGLDLMRVGLQAAGPLAKTAGASFLTLGQDAEKALTGEFWTRFLFNLNTAMPGAIEGLGSSFGNVVTGIAGVIDAFLPFTPTVVGGLEKVTAAFAEWGKQLGGSNDFKEFIAWCQVNAPEAWETIKDIAAALGHVAQAVAPLGVGAFSGLGLLADLVAGMSPETIRAVAVALLAVKAAQAGLAVASFWSSLTGGLDGVGGAADRAKGKLGVLKSALTTGGGIAAIMATAAIAVDQLSDNLSGLNPDIDVLAKRMSDLSAQGKPAAEMLGTFGSNLDTFGADMSRTAVWFAPTVGQFEKLGDTVGRLNSDNPFAQLTNNIAGLTDSFYTMDTGRQRLENFDKTLTQMVQSGNSEAAAKLMAELGKQSGLTGADVDELRALLPGYSQAVKDAGIASGDAANGVGAAKTKLDGFNESLSTFSGRTDALQAMESLKAAYSEAEKAIEAANGKLQISTRMTDEQKQAVILAREQFAGFVGKVRESADAQATLSGRTTDARDAVLRQLPAMLDLAGKNQEAREQVLALAKAYGISEGDAIKAAKGGQSLVEVLAKLKSKDIRVGADVKPAQEAIDNFITLNSGRKIPLHVYTKNSQLEAGAIMRYAEGGLQKFAAGGRSSPAPHVASSPTILYGEGRDDEAFIPYDPVFRPRAMDLVSQVANDFGGRFVPGSSAGAMGTPANSSRVSAPQQASPSRQYAPAPGGGAASGGGSWGGGSGSSGGPLVAMYGTVIREDMDADVVTAKISMAVDGRG